MRSDRSPAVVDAPARTPAAFFHAGLGFSPLSTCELRAAAAALDHPVVRGRMAGRHRGVQMDKALVDLCVDDAVGASAHWVVANVHGPCGLVALRPFHGALRTITLLAPHVHGTGVNAEVKQLLWSVAQDLVMPLVARCDPTNHRSRRAIARLWPSAVPVRSFHPDLGREMLLFDLDDAPRRTAARRARACRAG